MRLRLLAELHSLVFADVISDSGGTVKKVTAMKVNRIQRYDHIWSSSKSADDASSPVVPPGFAVMFLNHLTTEQRQVIEKNNALYRWAYEEARRKIDNDFIADWVI